MGSLVRMCFVVLVFAAPLVCRAQDAGALEPNDTAAAATDITAGFIAGGGIWTGEGLDIRTATDVDWFRVRLPGNAEGNLVATVSDLTGDLAGIVQIFQEVAGGVKVPVGTGVYAPWTQGTGSATVYAARAQGDYWIQVSSFAPRAGGYQLRVTAPLNILPKDIYEKTPPGNGSWWLATHLTLSGGATIQPGLSIYQTGYTEWFAFIAPPGAGGSAHLRITNVMGNLVPTVTLYTGSTASAGASVTAGGPNKPVALDVPGVIPGMIYYVRVAGDGNTTGRYDMAVNVDMPGALVVSRHLPLVTGNAWFLKGNAVAVIFSMPVAMSARVGGPEWFNGARTLPLNLMSRVRQSDIPLILYASQDGNGTDFYGVSSPGATFEGHPVPSLSVEFPYPLHLPALIVYPESGAWSGPFNGTFQGAPIRGTCNESFVMYQGHIYHRGRLTPALNVTLNFGAYANTPYGYLSLTGTQSMWLVQGKGIVQITSTNVLAAGGPAIPLTMTLSD